MATPSEHHSQPTPHLPVAHPLTTQNTMACTTSTVQDTIFNFPRPHQPTSEGPTEMCKLQAQANLDDHGTPMPSSEETNGRRPHAYLDDEGVLDHLRTGLPQLGGRIPMSELPYFPDHLPTTTTPSQNLALRPPVFWMYIGGAFNYRRQDDHGRPRKAQRNKAGGWRIITDWKKNFLTMMIDPDTYSKARSAGSARSKFKEVPTRIGDVKVTWNGGKICRAEVSPASAVTPLGDWVDVVQEGQQD